jgi:hypothetical protein
MEIVGWLWWLLSTIFGAALTVIWFLISGWVSTLLQIALIIVAVYFVKYGWQRAPAEVWRRTRSFGSFFVNWIRAREANVADSPAQCARVVRVKEFGDINISTLLSLLMLVGIVLVARL